MMLHFQTSTRGLIFKVHIQPRAAANQIAGVREDALKIRITAPPVDGEANKACIRLLSKQLKLPKSDLEIIAGAASRTKKILIHLPEAGTRAQQAQQIKKQIQAMAAQK